MSALAPIRIDVEADGVRFLDTFLVDINQASKISTPLGSSFEEYLAELLCRDFNLVSSSFRSQIATSIRLQMEDFSRFNVILQGPPLMLLIKLDIIAVGYNLIDQFEWQLNPECESYKNSPENYATKFVAEMSLNTEFISAIAHSIREQCHWARKALVNQGYDWNIDERSQIPYELMGLLSVNPKPLELRPEQEWDLYSPKVTKVDESASSIFHPSAQERESRRLRRQMRSKGMLGLGSSLGIFGMDSSWPLSFKVIRSPYPPLLDSTPQVQGLNIVI